MTSEEKFNLIIRNLEEILTEEELKKLIESDTPLKHYIGFEISGALHIGYLFTLLKVKDLQDAGAETIIWLADLHSAINDKLGGDLETIKRIALGYFTDAMKALFECIGGDPEKLIFKLTSETYAKNPDFWLTLLEIGKTTTLARTKRSITIMGRGEPDDSMPTDKLFYPIMQAADIFLLQTNIAHAGIDQRKVHVVARDAAMQVKTHLLKDAGGNQIKPVAIHHPILLGLDAKENVSGEADEVAMKTKMSKSKPGSSISIHDNPREIREKIHNAYSALGVVGNNPIINWVENLVFYGDQEVAFNVSTKFGGLKVYRSWKQLLHAYETESLHPEDLKEALAEWLIAKLEPARKYFEDPKRKRALEEMERLTKS